VKTWATRQIHWTAGFRLCFMLWLLGPPPVICDVSV
jgi:hypothetical protein